MRKVSALLLVLVGFLALNQTTSAGVLSSTLIRLDKSSPSSSLSGLVCAMPSSNATEGKISITFPNSFSISTSTANWTTDTVDIPAGSSPWPGIGSQAQNISGKVVSFVSSDLTPSIRYCFTFSSPASDTGTSTGHQTGVIATKTTGGAVIDSNSYGLTIGNDSVTLTATVPAQPGDFEVELTKDDPLNTSVHEDQIISYTITYGTSLTYDSSITVQAEWGLGTIAGSGSPSVDILDYVVGSASDALSTIHPVIDTINRTISWTISPMPSDIHDQTVSFQLKTNSSYTGPNIVTFPVSARVIGPGTQTPDSTISHSYTYIIQPTPTPGPPNTPTPGKAAAPTPTPSPLLISDIDVTELASDSATVQVRTNSPSTFTLLYGTSPSKLTTHFTTLQKKRLEYLRLTGLKLNTPYFFKIIAADGTNSITSDIYTFTTPTTAEIYPFDDNSLVVTSGESIVFNASYRKLFGGASKIVLPAHVSYTIQIAQLGEDHLRRVQAVLLSDNVLAASTDTTLPDDEYVDLTEVKPGIYVGQLRTPAKGVYTLSLRAFGSNGSIVLSKIGELRSSTPLTVYEKGTTKPVEGAIIRLSLYNQVTQLYQELSQQFSLKNYPVKTDQRGTTDLVLPPGTYRAEVKGLGFHPKTVDFTIGPVADQDYPVIYLERASFNLFETISYFAESFANIKTASDTYLASLFTSPRFFELTSVIGIIFLILMSVISLFRHIGLPLVYLPLLIRHTSKSVLSKQSGQRLEGEIVDKETGKPLSGVHIFLLDGISKSALAGTITQSQGRFAFGVPPTPVGMRIEKQGYLSAFHPVEKHPGKALHFTLTKDTLPNASVSYLKFLIEVGWERFIELLLLGSLFVELIFGYSFGWLHALPFIVISLINMLFYLYYERITRD